jgi:two-component system, sensor histidine kinase and response regulator
VSTPNRPSRRPWWLMSIFIVFALALAGVGLMILRYQRQWLKDVTLRATVTSMDTRVATLLAWRNEQVAEGSALASNTQLSSQSVALLGASPTNGARLAWDQSLAIVLAHPGRKAAVLLDESGQVRRAMGTLSPAIRDRAVTASAAARRTRRVEISSPYGSEDGSLAVVMAIPVQSPGADGARSPAAIALEIDAQRELAGVLRGRAAPSSNSDILLVNPGSPDASVLAGVHGSGPLFSGTQIAAASHPDIVGRLLRGEEGPFEGRTLGGTPGVGVTRKVGDTGWWLVALVSTESPLATLAVETWRLAAIVGLIVLTTGVLVLWFW